MTDEHAGPRHVQDADAVLALRQQWKGLFEIAAQQFEFAGGSIRFRIVRFGCQRFERGEQKLTVFRDGRAIIQGTTDVAVARTLYARYIGS